MEPMRFIAACFFSGMIHVAVLFIATGSKSSDQKWHYINPEAVEFLPDHKSVHTAKALDNDLRKLKSIASKGESKEDTPISTTLQSMLQSGNVKPSYPKLARTRGWEGTVTIKVNFDSEPASVVILSSSGHEILDEAAALAAVQWHRPMGVMVSSVIVPIVFELE